jgi:hypothetical protein
MNVAAPPKPPPLLLRASVDDDTAEALIKEAKQRARRRHWSYGTAAVVVAIAVVAAFTIPGSPSLPDGAARAVPKPPTPLGAPLVQGADAASTLLESWGQFQVGYAFVYADGRVVLKLESGVFLDADGRMTGNGEGCCTPGDDGPRPEYVAVERRLSARGLKLVRTGKLHPKRFLVTRDVDREGRILIEFAGGETGIYQRKGLWAEPTARVYEPSKYAICPGTTDTLGLLPASAQVLLNGKQNTYDPNIGTANWGVPPGPPMECFEVTSAEFSTLQQLMPPSQGWLLPLVAEGEFVGSLDAFPIYPHGQPVGHYSG